MTPAEAQAVAAFQKMAVETAQALRERLDAAPKPADKVAVETAVEALIGAGLVEEARKQAAVASLADPTTAVETITNLVTKFATDARLRGGVPVDPKGGSTGATKYASNGQPVESEADRLWAERMARYRKA